MTRRELIAEINTLARKAQVSEDLEVRTAAGALFTLEGTLLAHQVLELRDHLRPFIERAKERAKAEISDSTDPSSFH